MDNKMDKNLEHVNEIVETMEKYASGDYFMYDGDLYPIDTEDFDKINGCKYDDENELYIMPDGEEIPENYIEPASLYDYFSDYLDIDYIVDREKQYKAARILVAWGGPTIYIDTCDRQVQLYWWSEHAEADIPMNICDEIDEIFRDFYEC